MIRVSRLDGKEFVVNCELIELIEETPDTVLTLVNSQKLVILQPAEEVIARVIAYKRRVHDCATAQGSQPPSVQE
jgi:flagellar protein FlbD